jgi:hypothetical protein
VSVCFGSLSLLAAKGPSPAEASCVLAHCSAAPGPTWQAYSLVGLPLSLQQLQHIRFLKRTQRAAQRTPTCPDHTIVAAHLRPTQLATSAQAGATSLLHSGTAVEGPSKQPDSPSRMTCWTRLIANSVCEHSYTQAHSCSCITARSWSSVP